MAVGIGKTAEVVAGNGLMLVVVAFGLRAVVDTTSVVDHMSLVYSFDHS